MILQLKCSTCQFPPGGFGFIDPRTKRIWPGFEGTPEMTSTSIIQHRLANPNIYPRTDLPWFDKASVIQEIYAQKYATMPELFIGHGTTALIPKAAVLATTSSPCAKCGNTQAAPVYCPTCSGQKITGYRCAGCGTLRGP